MRKMPGVHYPDPAPPADGPALLHPLPDSDDELAMAQQFVRKAFDPPLPDTFAHWLIELHKMVRDGYPPQYAVVIPPAIRQQGYTFQRATVSGSIMRLDDALALFGRDDLLPPTPPEPVTAEPGQELHPHEGTVALAAALVARGIRTTVQVHNRDGGCTLRLDDAQAAQLADFLVPVEGSEEDRLGHALELLDHFVHSPRPTPCQYDHHGQCQEHHDTLDGYRSAQHEGHELLVAMGVREGTS